MDREEKPLFVMVDGSSYLYRAFHALPSLTTSEGAPTGAMHGVLAMLRRLVEDYPSEFLAVVFDPRGKTTRNEWYPQYKANRPSMPEELSSQVGPLLELIEASGFPLVQVDGVEADDVIGTLSARATAAGYRVLISTGDKDMAQLVDDDVTLINTMDNSLLTPDGVMKKFGVRPNQIIDYLTLVGDTVDNIPGVPKVGPKTAVKWLTEYDSLDALVANAEAIKGKVGENLRASLEDLPLSKRLVTIIKDLDLGVTLTHLRPATPDPVRLSQLFQNFEFTSWLKDLKGDATVSAPQDVTADNYETILNEADFDRWLKTLSGADQMAFDTETTSLFYTEARVVGMSFAVAPGAAAYLPLAHDYPGCPQQLDFDQCLERLKPLLEADKPGKVGHHLKYDRNVLLNHGVKLGGIEADSMLESYVLNSTASRHDLDSLALKYLDHNTTHFEDVAGKGAKQITFDQVPLEQAAPYAAEDADISLRLHEFFQSRLADKRSLKQILDDLEVPLIPVLSKMETTGVLIDADLLGKHSQELEQEMTTLAKVAFEEAGETFNLGSPKQIQHILFEKQGLPVKSKTAKGQPSTSEAVLQELAEDYELPRLILEHRSLAKLKSTYTDKLPQQVSDATGRVHTSYHQAVAATGRLSSSDPNLQNIPIRTAQGRRIRKAFIAPPNHLLLAADYSQIELRIMAHLSGDEALVNAFNEGLDVHRATAAEVFAAPGEEVGEEERRAAKAINFGLIYGMSAFGLARQLKIERSAAQQYIERYFERYPGVRNYMDDIRETARAQGYVETIFGRRLYLPEINARNAQRRQYAERTAINAPMQGSAADIIKRAMLAVDAWLNENSPQSRLIMQVHDELVLEVPRSDVEQVSKSIAKIMSAAADIKVPLTVDCGWGANWDEAH
ncbi:MAG: DNA polymerase I [Pseudomonadota bacterium]